jgi:hypothetical protein
MRELSHLIAGIAAATVVSCGGGGSSPPPSPIQGVSPGGIWRGTDSASGLAIIGLVDETGDGVFIRADHAQFAGQVSTSDNSISVSAQGYAGSQPFPDGSTHGTWSMNGTIQERESISATTVFTTDNGTETQGSLDLKFDALYNRPSSLATVAGEFAPVNVIPYYIGSDGSISQHALICETNGEISVVDPTYNLYRMQMTETCDYGGTTNHSGLATLDNTVSPERLVFGLQGDSAYADTWLRCSTTTC